MAKQATKEKLLAHQKIVMQKNVEIQKQKQDLLQKQIQQQKVIIDSKNKMIIIYFILSVSDLPNASILIHSVLLS